MNEEYKFEKGSFIHIKRDGKLELSSLKPEGWRHIRPIVSYAQTLKNFVPSDGRNFEQLALKRYCLFFRDN